MNCPKCNYELKDGSKFCSSCGEKIEEEKKEEEVKDTPHFCSECGAQLKDDSKFCSSCGKKLDKKKKEEVVEEEKDLLPKSEEILKAESAKRYFESKKTDNSIKSFVKKNNAEKNAVKNQTSKPDVSELNMNKQEDYCYNTVTDTNISTMSVLS